MRLLKSAWDIILFVVCLIILIYVLATGTANAHGWYDHDCCHDNDCAPVLSVNRSPEGDILVSKHGTVLIPPTFDSKRRRQSKDDKFHVCMRPAYTGSTEMVPLCVYYPALY